MQNKVVFITGSNGFVGGRLARRFIDCGYSVHGYDVAAEGNVAGVLYHTLCEDLSSFVKLISAINPGYVIHCAGNADVNYSVSHPLVDFDRNVLTLYNLLDSLEKARISPRILFPSSAAVYGTVTKMPISENDDLRPISPYGLHKRICEDICQFYVKTKGFDIIIARIFSAYGPGLKKQIFWDMYTKASCDGSLSLFGTGSESRDFIFIDDLINALLMLVLNGETGQVYNVAKGEEITIKDLARYFVAEYGKPISIEFDNIVREGNPLNWRADITRLRDLGFSCDYDISQGVKKTIEWLRNEKK